MFMTPTASLLWDCMLSFRNRTLVLLLDERFVGRAVFPTFELPSLTGVQTALRGLSGVGCSQVT